MSEQEPKRKNDETTQEKPKRKNKARQVEWSFDFANFSEGFNRFMASLAGDEEIHHTSYRVEKAGVQSARIDLNFSLGKCNVQPLANSDNLFEADITHVGELEYEVEGDAVKVIELKQQDAKDVGGPIRQGFRAFASRDDLKWEIGLAPNVPLSLDVDGGVGSVHLQLNGLTVSELEVDTGVGRMQIDLPAQAQTYNVDLDSGVGQTTINIPDGADVRLEIDGGVGTTEVNIPPGAAVQLTADTGIGGISVPQEMRRVSGKPDFMDNSGVWQTEGFELAERRIVIRYDGGVGQFRLRYVEIV